MPALPWKHEYLSQRGLDNLIASGAAPGPEVFLVSNDLRPPKSDQATLGIRQQAGNWQLGLAYSYVRVKNGMSWFFGDLPPGTPSPTVSATASRCRATPASSSPTTAARAGTTASS